MDLRQLEIVQAVAETGSFTGAGRKLRVSQSAISRQILLLEEELNESIFLRVGRRIRITPAGDALVQLSHRVFGDIKETVTVIGESQQVLSGTMRLAGGMTVCMYVFPMLLQEYRRQHSLVEVKLITGHVAAAAARDSERRGRSRLHHAAGERARAGDRAGDGRGDDARGASLASAREKEAHRAAGPRAAAVRALRGGLEFAPGRRRVFHQRAHRAAHRDGNRKRRDSEGAGAVRDGRSRSSRIRRSRAKCEAGSCSAPGFPGAQLVRHTGWVYQRSNKVPRMLEEMFKAYERILPKLNLSPASRISSLKMRPEGQDYGSAISMDDS